MEPIMKIIDLDITTQQSYFHCLEDWSEDIREAGLHKADWYAVMKDKGLRVKLAIDETRNAPVGMIQYAPVEHTHILGTNLYFIYCIWVHGYKQGIGNHQKKGIGTLLLTAAETDARALGAQGIAAWGLSLPVWMKASWFKKHGYQKVDKDGIALLMWKPFNSSAAPPQWIHQTTKHDFVNPGKVTVTSFVNGWCPAQNLACERAKRAAASFGDDVIFNEIHTLDKEVFSKWCISDALYIDNKQINTGPPPTLKKLTNAIGKRVKRISR
jgi:GNAT superfamily N-acetyltransferase